MAGLSRFVPNPIGIEDALHGSNGPVYKGIIERCVAVTAEAKRRCPVKTGRLRASIRFQIGLGPIGYVGTDVNYAMAVHAGTKAHDIYPKNASVLAFDVGGQTVFAASVHHPGTKGVPFLTRALIAAAE